MYGNKKYIVLVPKKYGPDIFPVVVDETIAKNRNYLTRKLAKRIAKTLVVKGKKAEIFKLKKIRIKLPSVA